MQHSMQQVSIALAQVNFKVGDIDGNLQLIADAIVDATLAITPAAQRGFCRGRQLSLNVVDLDTYSRAFSICVNIDLTEELRGQLYRGNISDIPAAMLHDFCNAFPTVLHEWMWLVLKIIKLP